ncbi:CopD family protein [Putridiphycobacter roseus]|uniref:Protoporphyrinogen IX oxidase n=1 Tax=Putridiphycobacter roseus TaxID=2219161 RepID=A0A2W1N4Q3_9FLAO|nr:CopD family protein [Putridiphycobacter roseus]PZE18794.1 CopD family protein [Putridiphycobacter roseus]
MFLYLKALHIIFVVTWFAGLFYVVRLFIYHVEAEDKPTEVKTILQNQYQIMTKRLWYIITWPSAIIVLITASLLLINNPTWLTFGWMHIKLGFVLLLYLYHLRCHKIFKDLQKNNIKTTSTKLRIWNEGATLLLFAIVFVVVLKSTLNWIFGVLGILSLGIILMILIKWYKKYRAKKASL